MCSWSYTSTQNSCVFAKCLNGKNIVHVISISIHQEQILQQVLYAPNESESLT